MKPYEKMTVGDIVTPIDTMLNHIAPRLDQRTAYEAHEVGAEFLEKMLNLEDMTVNLAIFTVGVLMISLMKAASAMPDAEASQLQVDKSKIN
jgi:hypothetical protein